jgi:hypothetical protein
MTQEEFSSYRRRGISQYAAELVRAGASTAAQAEQQATKEIDGSLPDGVDTGSMALLVGEAAGEVVGVVWLGPAPAGRALVGGNDVAQGMYESSGYEVAAIQMHKHLTS